jgi:phage-related protein
MIHFDLSSSSPSTLVARFYRGTSGREPVRDWLKSLPQEERRQIGADIRTVQLGWPIGMPLVGHLDEQIWEVRTQLAHRIARVLFAQVGGDMILLHGFIKKDRKTPKPDLDLARNRLKKLRSAS